MTARLPPIFSSSRRWMVEKRHAINDAALREQLHIYLLKWSVLSYCMHECMNVYLMHSCMNAYERLAGLTPRKLHSVYVCPSRTRTRQGCTAVVHYHTRYIHTYIYIHKCIQYIHLQNLYVGFLGMWL